MPSYPIVTGSRSSSLSNPCPDGTGIGYGDWNGTILVICDAAFNKAKTDSLALGLGLGLGIPGFLLLVALLRYSWSKRESLCPLWRKKGSVSPPGTALSAFVTRELADIILSNDEYAYTPPISKTMKNEMTAQSLQDILSGNLTDSLKEELMTIRMKKGRDLLEYFRYADECNQPEIADWIYRMNPCDFPRHIREKGAEHHIIHVREIA